MKNVYQKPEIHISALLLAEKCGEAYRRRHVLGEIIPPGISLHVGQTVHKSGEKELIHKVTTGGELLSTDAVKSAASDLFKSEVEEKGLQLDEDEQKEGLKKVMGAGTDLAVSLAGLYHTDLAPIIEPVSVDHIERPWVVETDAYPFNLGGKMDVCEKRAFRDTKTAGQSPNQAAVDSSEQYTMYAMAYKVLEGELPEVIYQDTLVKLKTPKVKTVETTRTQEDFYWLLARLSRFAEVIEKGVFLPARREDWWCSVKYCGYAKTCPFFNGKINYFQGR